MACGCSDNSCSCVINGGTNVTVSGGGSAGNPFVINASSAETTFAATSTDHSLVITPGGTDGHAPNFDLHIDPDSPSAITVTTAGIAVAAGGGSSTQLFKSADQFITIGDGTTGGDTATPIPMIAPISITSDGTKQYYLNFTSPQFSANIDSATDLGVVQSTLYLIDEDGPTIIATSDIQLNSASFPASAGHNSLQISTPVSWNAYVPPFTGTKMFHFEVFGASPGQQTTLYQNSGTDSAVVVFVNSFDS